MGWRGVRVTLTKGELLGEVWDRLLQELPREKRLKCGTWPEDKDITISARDAAGRFSGHWVEVAEIAFSWEDKP